MLKKKKSSAPKDTQTAAESCLPLLQQSPREAADESTASLRRRPRKGSPISTLENKVCWFITVHAENEASESPPRAGSRAAAGIQPGRHPGLPRRKRER